MKKPITLFWAFIFCVLAINAHADRVLSVPHMHQPDDQTCLPTTFLMALNFMGKEEKFSSGAVQSLHKRTQYNRFNASEIAADYGLHALSNWNNLAWTTETIKNEIDNKRPVILGVNQGRSGHFVLGVGYTDDGRVIIHDPGRAVPGNKLGGPYKTVAWEDMLWRGGIIFSDKPFETTTPISAFVPGEDGLPLEAARQVKLQPGETTVTKFTLVNNGTEAWPAGTTLDVVDPNSSPTVALGSKLRPAASAWKSASRVKSFDEAVAPGTTVTVEIAVTAPPVDETTTILQYFNLREPDGRWFSENWLAGPGNRQIAVRAIVIPQETKTWELPLEESFAEGKPTLEWRVKHGGMKMAEGVTSVPEKLPAVSLLTAGQSMDAAWVGSHKWRDYTVEAWVWCELRLDEEDAGYERVGIFAHDNGQHMPDRKNEIEIGEALAMTFDSDDGSIRAGSVYNGVIGDFRGKRNRHKIKESGWHHFKMAIKDNAVAYFLDGKPFHTESLDGAYPEGDTGVYYSTTFPFEGSVSNPKGVVFAGFKVTE